MVFPDSAPLRRKLELVVAAVHPRTKDVMLQAVTLFPVGARPGADTRLTVHVTHEDEDGTVLTVVCFDDDGPRPLSIDSLRLSPGVHELRAVLETPERVRFVEPAEAMPDHRSWSELVAALPKTWMPPVADTALICAIELAEDGFDARRELVRDLVDLARQQGSAPDALRVAVLGYGDHVFRPDEERKKVVRGAWLDSPGQALVSLDRLKATASGGLPVAPVEDALHQVAKRIGTVPHTHRAVLLTLGRRPPHPARAGDPAVLPCPHEYDWDRLLRRVEARPGLVRAAVLDTPDLSRIREPGGRTDSVRRAGLDAWRRLGKDVLVAQSETDPHQLANALRLLNPPSRRLSFPMLSPADPL